jgi:hypothetical protein
MSDCAAYLYGTVVVGGQNSVRPGAKLQHVGYQPAKKEPTSKQTHHFRGM